MALFESAMMIFLAGAFFLLFTGRGRFANIAGPLFSVAGAVLSLISGIDSITTGGFDFILSWGFQLGAVHLKMDPLSGFFVMMIAVVCGLSAAYGKSYLEIYIGKKHLGICWSFFLLLAFGMLLVVTAWNGVLFLVAWEIMSVSSFFLVIFEFDRPGVLKAGWIYLVATHLGTAFLMVMFMVLGSHHSYDFNLIQVSAPMATLVFILAFVGFGTKAGFVPFHVWLPEAHPAAPSHVSAVMSAAMIKTGIYGILRICILVGPVQVSWGWTLIISGAVTGIFGVLCALSQRDLKRLLAYSSVENVGIIAIGFGLGFLGLATGHPNIGILGIAGGILHMMNHAIFKSLLFFGAGAVRHAIHTLDIEKMGGLIKKMPVTGATFIIASVAICALPPFNGFVGEFLIYVGSFSSLYGAKGTFSVLAGITVIVSLALIGGLALACFTKAVGIAFSGEPRSSGAQNATEAGLLMKTTMVVLSCLCLLIGLFSPQVVLFMAPVFKIIMAGSDPMGSSLQPAVFSLTMISRTSAGLLLAVGLIALIKNKLLKKRPKNIAITWDCGYSHPTAKMQYTAASFIDPTIHMFDAVICSQKKIKTDHQLFPKGFSLETSPIDIFLHWVYLPIFSLIEYGALKLHWLQRGYNQLYILYLVITLLALLFWMLWF